MTSSPPPASAPQRGLSTTSKVLLFVVAPLVLLAILGGVIFAGLSVFRGASIAEQGTADAGHSVVVDIASANLRFAPSSDGQVHISMTGSFSGQRPTLTVTTADDVTTVRGGCPRGWLFSRCDITVAVQLPGELPLQVQGTNGRIDLADLAGDIVVATSNGRIEATSTSGNLELRTVNGAIHVQNSVAKQITASSTNGRVELDFSSAPSEVTASTTNGAITVRVPDDASRYFIEAHTVNGRINTDAVPSDRTAERTITATTTNGSVTVERSGQ
jgi:hypothetical protein